MIREKIMLISKIVRENPLVWLVPLLLILIDSVIDCNPILLFGKLLVNSPKPIVVGKALLTAVLAIIAISFVFTIIIIIIRKIFLNFEESIGKTTKKYSLILVVLTLIILFPLNVGIEVLCKFIRKYEFVYYTCYYFLLSFKNIFFYFTMFVAVDKAVIGNKPNFPQDKHLFSKRIILELLTISLCSSLIQVPLYYEPCYMCFPFESYLIGRFQLLCKILINTFLIVYTAVLYYGRRKGNNAK